VVKPGESVHFWGDPWASTNVLRKIAGFSTPTMGEIFINSEPISEMTFQEFLPYRLNLGYVFNHGGLIHNKTLRENLLFPFLYHSTDISRAESKVDEALLELKLDSMSHRRPSEVPGFVRKLTTLLRTLLMEPQVLLLDDPTAGLNATAIESVRARIQSRLKQNPTGILILNSESTDLLSGLKLRTHDFAREPEMAVAA
jgi:ABC-type sulfate/molybdate transport systems ATPase subunit